MQKEVKASPTVRENPVGALPPMNDTTPGPMWSRFFEESCVNEDRTLDPAIEERVRAANATMTATQSVPSVNGSQSCTTVVPGLVNGTGFVFKFRDPLSQTIHRFSGRVVAGEMGESPLAELLEAVVRKCGCHILLDEDYDAIPIPSLFASAEGEMCDQQMRNSEFNNGSKNRSQAILRQYLTNHYLAAQPTVAPVLLAPTAGSTSMDEFAPVTSEEPIVYHFRISYKDDEGDLVFLHSDADLMDAVGVARMMGWGRIVIRVEVYFDDPLTGQRVPIAREQEADVLLMERDGTPENSVIVDRSNSTNHWNDLKKKSPSMGAPVMIAMMGVAVGALGIGMMIASRWRRS